MITRRPGKKHLNVAFIKEILNKKKRKVKTVSPMSRALLWCKPCSHELGVLSRIFAPGPARVPVPVPPAPPQDPVGNAIKELSPHSHSQAPLPPPLPLTQNSNPQAGKQATRAEKDLSNTCIQANKHKTL